MPQRDVVVIGASAGGVDALIRIAARLPADLPAAVLVVLHLSPRAPSNLANILDRVGPLAAVQAEDGMDLRPGRIVCAPPDRHLILEGGHVRVTRGPHENLHRPSVDVLFRSAAVDADGRTCGIILSGALDDGTSGMRAIQASGGLTVVQDPAEAVVPSMPRSVLEVMTPDHVLPVDEIGARLPALLAEPRDRSRRTTGARRAALEREIAMSRFDAQPRDEGPPGDPSPWACPDCGGVLGELDDDQLRFRCRVGHAYTARSLMAAGDSRLEDSLWAALRALEEQESLTRRLLDRTWAHGAEGTRQRLRERMEEAHRRALVLREFLLVPTPNDSDDGEAGARADIAAAMGRSTAAHRTEEAPAG